MEKFIVKIAKVPGGSTFEACGSAVEIFAALSTFTESLMESFTDKCFFGDQKISADAVLYSAKLGIEHYLEKHQNCGGG